MPTLLAIDTSTTLASAALLRGNDVILRESSGVQTHSANILPMVQALLAEAGIVLNQCDAIAFGAGPGSFTGVRTACGVAQGLGFGAALPVVPVITLEAMAEACRDATGAADVLPVLDAAMGEVYWAQYRFDGSDWTAVVEPTLSAPAAVAPQGNVLACGNGLRAHAAVFAGRDGMAGALPGVTPHAAQVARIGLRLFQRGHAVPASDAQPFYLRNKVAFTTAEREARARAAS